MRTRNLFYPVLGFQKITPHQPSTALVSQRPRDCSDSQVDRCLVFQTQSSCLFLSQRGATWRTTQNGAEGTRVHPRHKPMPPGSWVQVHLPFHCWAPPPPGTPARPFRGRKAATSLLSPSVCWTPCSCHTPPFHNKSEMFRSNNSV